LGGAYLTKHRRGTMIPHPGKQSSASA